MSNFILDNDGFTNVYVDGCQLSNGDAGYGIFWGNNNHK